MKTEVTFILFMILIYAIVLIGYLWVKARSEKKRCQNCAFFTLRKESKSVGTCKQHSNCHLHWEKPASSGSTSQIIRTKQFKC